MGLKSNVCICICGKTGSGKTRISNIFKEDFQYREYSFGTPVREFMKKALPNINYHNNPKARQVIIDVAEAPKRIAPRCWAYALTESIAGDNYPDKVIIPDLRFEVELNHIKSIMMNKDFGGGYNIHLIKVVSDYDRHIKKLKEELSKEDNELLDKLESDPSNLEFEKFEFDYIIRNTSSIREAEIEVRKIHQKITDRNWLRNL